MVVSNNILYHIGIRPEDGASAAIICGDPGRVKAIAQLMDNSQFLAERREFTSFKASLGERPLLVMSHGIGGPSTAICVEELYMAGVRTIIRVGTCGGMSMSVKTGELVIASSAIRAEGTSREYLPIEYPAAADFEVTAALRDAADTSAHAYHVGVVHCKDSFYGQHSPERMPIAEELKQRWSAWLRAGCLASEMETAALFCVSASLGIRAGAVLRAVWNQERVAAGIIDPPDSDELSAARTAIEAMRRLMR